MRVSITVSEPWDLGEAIHWEPIFGELIAFSDDQHGGKALIKLASPVRFGDSSWTYVISRPRHLGDRIDSLRDGLKVLSACTGITAQQAESASPFDTQEISKGLAFISDIEPGSAS